MKKYALLLCFVVFFMAGCKTNDMQKGQADSETNTIQKEQTDSETNTIQKGQAENDEENTKTKNKNYGKISEAYKKYCTEKNIAILNFAPCEDLDRFFEKSGRGEIHKVSVTDIKVCEILNAEKKDVVIHMYAEDALYSCTYIFPFVYSDNSFQLNEKAIVICTKLLNYTLIDIDGDAQNEILAEYIVTHNGTNHIIQILKCDTSKKGSEIFYKSVDEFTHKLKYGFSEEIPKKFWIQDIKTYINQEKKKKVAKKVKYLYVLKKGKYQIKQKKTDKKSDMSDFYEWALG